MNVENLTSQSFRVDREDLTYFYNDNDTDAHHHNLFDTFLKLKKI